MRTRSKKSLSLLLALMLLVSLFSGLSVPVAAADAQLGAYTETAALADLSGAPEAGGVYGVSTAAELEKLAAIVNGGNACTGVTFYLKADIDLAGSEAKPWTPIGQYDPNTEKTDPQTSFDGLFDGCGHKVAGLYVGGADYAGGAGIHNEANALFGTLGTHAVVRDLYVSGEVHTYRTGAGIAGVNNGSIQRCFAAVNVSANGGGGLRGSGGIAGTNYGTVENCISTGSVHNDYRRAGGIVGYHYGSGAKIASCVSLGTVSSASSGYAGGIAASNGESAETAGSITGCWYLSGSCEAAIGLDKAATAQTVGQFNAQSFTLDGSGAATTTSLLSALNQGADPAYFIAPAGGAFPVLFWQPGYSWLSYEVTVANPAGGSFAASLNGQPFTGTKTLNTGTVVTLTASEPAAGYFFGGFTVTALNNHDNLLTSGLGKGSLQNGVYTLDYAVGQNATLSAAYIAYTDTALTVYTQTGNGALTPVKTYSWNDLLTSYKLSAPAGHGYLYTHGADGWTVIGVTEYADVLALLRDSGADIQDDYLIVPMDGDSQPSVLATYGMLKEDRYFYPDTVTVNNTPVTNAAKVPAAIGLSWATSADALTLPADASTGDKLAAAAGLAVNSGNLRYVWGSSEADYVGIANADGSITGNRLWNNVDGLIIRNPHADFTFAGEPLTLAQLKAYEQTKTFTNVKNGVTSSFTVKGITAADLLAHFYDGGEAASLTFADSTGFAGTALNSDYSWDDVMLLWSMVDESGAEKITSGLRSAVNGSAPKLWVTGAITASVVDKAVSIDGVSYSTEQLKAHATTKELTDSKGSTVTVTGVTAADLETYFISADTAALRFTAADGFAANVLSSDYSWDDVMLIWDGAGASEQSLRSAVSGGAGKLWVSGVATVEGTPAALVYNGTRLSFDQLQALGETKTFLKKGAEKVMTGATLSALQAAFGGSGAAKLKATEAAENGFSATVDNGFYDWDDVMVAWEGDGAAADSLKLAVNGGAGKLWVSSLYTLELTPAELTIDGRGFTKAQLQGSAETATLTNVKGATVSSYAVTGVSFETLASVYGLSADTVSYTFTASDGFQKTASVGPTGDFTTNKAWIIWSQVDETGAEQLSSGFKCAFDGSAKGLWVSGLKNVSVGYRLTVNAAPAGAAVTVKDASGTTLTAEDGKYTVQSGETYTYEAALENYVTKTGSVYIGGADETLDLSLDRQTYTVSFDLTPETAAVELKDASGAVVSGGPKYTLSSGETYTYTVSASGYTSQSGSLTVSKKETVTIALSPTGGSGGGEDPQEPTVLTLYVQQNGSTEKVAELSKEDLYELVDNTGAFVYQYYKSDAWEGVVATKVASYDSLFGSVGYSFRSGDSIQPTAADGFYDTRSYENITAQHYAYDVDTGTQTVVPAGIAVEWDGGSLSGGGAARLAASAYYGKLRSVVGITRQMYEESPVNAASGGEVTARGMRLVTGVASVTLIKGESVNANPKQNQSSGTEDNEEAASTVTEATVHTDVQVTDGKATAAVTKEDTAKALEAAKTENQEAVTISAVTEEAVNEVSVTVPKDALSDIGSAGKAVTVESDVGSLTLNADALLAVGAAEGEEVAITLETVSAADAQELAKTADGWTEADVADAITVKISVQAGGKRVTSFGGGKVTVDIPVDDKYAEGESYKVLVVSDDGKSQLMAAKIVLKDGKPVAQLSLTHLTAFVVTRLPAITFADVKKGDWYYDAVVYASVNGLFTGVSEDEFAPKDHMTRAMLAVVLYRMAGSPAVTGESAFSDVQSGAWYSSAVLWASQNGIVNGLENGSFGVGQNVTRQQMAAMLLRYAAYKGYDTLAAADLSAFADANEVADWAEAAMSWANAAGLITGRSETTLAPDGTATRAEVATILQRFAQLYDSVS